MGSPENDTQLPHESCLKIWGGTPVLRNRADRRDESRPVSPVEVPLPPLPGVQQTMADQLLNAPEALKCRQQLQEAQQAVEELTRKCASVHIVVWGSIGIDRESASSTPPPIQVQSCMKTEAFFFQLFFSGT